MELLENSEIGGIGIVVLTIAVTQWAKSIGLDDVGLKIFAALFGTLMGFLYQIQNGFPEEPLGWIPIAVFALAAGFMPSGVIDAARAVVARGVAKANCK